MEEGSGQGRTDLSSDQSQIRARHSPRPRHLGVVSDVRPRSARPGPAPPLSFHHLLESESFPPARAFYGRPQTGSERSSRVPVLNPAPQTPRELVARPHPYFSAVGTPPPLSKETACDRQGDRKSRESCRLPLRDSGRARTAGSLLPAPFIPGATPGSPPTPYGPGPLTLTTVPQVPGTAWGCAVCRGRAETSGGDPGDRRVALGH